MECDCRKPRPGLLLQAAAERGIDVRTSFMVGDRPTDIAAGAAAGCATIQVGSVRHDAPPIVTVGPIDASLEPDHECADLARAADWILEGRSCAPSS